ncbi:MAG: response regulator transcription factor [Chloroflexi bacterium]|nr:response regulator transcription factor [Chloroflexota bacterium]
MSQTDKIRLMIVDDHTIVRQGVRALLEDQPDIEMVAEAVDGAEAVQKAKDIQPDIILMDITMPVLNGLEATRRIKQQSPQIKVLVLTMHESDEYFFEILKVGASGYFIKGGSASELVSAIHAVARGDVFLYPTMAKKLMTDYLHRIGAGQGRESYDGLTNREREILKLIAEGNTNQEIADLLKLSVTTVQTHRAHVMAKLGLHSPAELIKYALRQGFITLDS